MLLFCTSLTYCRVPNAARCWCLSVTSHNVSIFTFHFVIAQHEQYERTCGTDIGICVFVMFYVVIRRWWCCQNDSTRIVAQSLNSMSVYVGTEYRDYGIFCRYVLFVIRRWWWCQNVENFVVHPLCYCIVHTLKYCRVPNAARCWCLSVCDEQLFLWKDGK